MEASRNLRGSWGGQFTGAGLRLNEDLVWGPTCWEKAVSVPANTIYKSYATMLTKVVEQHCKWKSSQQAKRQHKNHDKLLLTTASVQEAHILGMMVDQVLLMFHKMFLQTIFKILWQASIRPK